MNTRKARTGDGNSILIIPVLLFLALIFVFAVPAYRANLRKARAAEGAALLNMVLTAEKLYYTEHYTFTTSEAALNIQAAGNQHFTDYTVTSADANGFTAATSGTRDATGITVTMTYDTRAAGPVFRYDGL